jgi:glycosyltransferase involved in cell wall biosynthesis
LARALTIGERCAASGKGRQIDHGRKLGQEFDEIAEPQGLPERQPPQTFDLALIAGQAFTLVNFRGTLIALLAGKGLRICALAPDYDEDSRNGIRALGAVPIDCGFSRTGMNPIRDIQEAVKLVARLRVMRVRVSLGYGIKPAIFGTLAAWLAGVDRRYVMIEGLGYLFSPAEGSERVRRAIMRTLARCMYRVALPRARKVFFLNDDDIADFTRSRLVRPHQVVRLGATGVDLERWTMKPAIRDPVTFMMAARLLREKGVALFVEAAKRVKALHPETRFVLLGALDTNPGAVSPEELRLWTSSGAIEWTGHVDVAPWLARASVFVLPSYYREGVPRSIQEAMAMGRAVITTLMPGCRDTVVDGRNGFLVQPRNVEALVDAMLRFVRQPELIEEMGRESRAIAEERFDARKADGLIWRTLFAGDMTMAPDTAPGVRSPSGCTHGEGR